MESKETLQREPIGSKRFEELSALPEAEVVQDGDTRVVRLPHNVFLAQLGQLRRKEASARKQAKAKRQRRARSKAAGASKRANRGK